MWKCTGSPVSCFSAWTSSRAAAGLTSPAMSLMPRMWVPASRSARAMREVVVEVVAAAALVVEVAGVADRRLAELPGLQHRIDRDAHVLDRVQGVEDAEDIDARSRGLAHEAPHHVVRVVGVADPVGGAQQHLQQDVRYLRAQPLQALPRALAQEAERHVEGGAAPAFEREELRQVVGVGVCDLAEIVRAHPGREQGLVRVPHRGVGDEHTAPAPASMRRPPPAPRHRAAPWRPPPASSAWSGGGLPDCGRTCRRRGPVLHLGVAVDGGLGDVAQEPARPVARAGESQELRVVVDEAGRHLPAARTRFVTDQTLEEIDVGGDAPDAELLERAAHAVDGSPRARAPTR